MHLSRVVTIVYIILLIIVGVLGNDDDQDNCSWSPFCMIYKYLWKYREHDVIIKNNIPDDALEIPYIVPINACTDFVLHVDAECYLNDKHIDVRNIIGTGGSATIYKVIYKDSFYALKLFKNNSTSKRQSDYKKELSVLLLLRDVGSIPSIYDYRNGKYPCILMQYFINGDLVNYISYNQNTYAPNMMINVAMKFLNDIGTALYNLHNIGINHMDIKPENILYDYNPLRFYLADHAFSIPFNNGRPGNCPGSRLYLTPEHLRIYKNSSAIISHVSCIDRYNMVCIYIYTF